jgi:predicted AAA+ superfamily ATPase
MRLQRRPQEFSEILAGLPESIEWVFVDEVQKLPQLLDEVHRQIERNPKCFFALTGSSARKLKRGQANLLAGRAFTLALAPLTSLELGKNFNLGHALSFGTLPKVCAFEHTEDKNQFLRSYAHTYLQEEVQSEGLIRNLPGFQRFVPLAGTENGNILLWSNFAQDAGVSAKTVRAYFEILEDTLIGFFLPAYHRSLRKRQRTHPKFYLFDPGVKRALAGELTRPRELGTAEYGRAFEHFWILEIMRLSRYLQNDWNFSYFATHDVEIDLVIERPGQPLLFVEMKSSDRVKDGELKNLRALVEEVEGSVGVCVSREPRTRRVHPRVSVVPWQDALAELGLAG